MLDTADASAIDGSNSEVAVFTPGLTPGVSHDVVIDTVFGTIANGHDSMVQVSAAILTSNDTASVLVEDIATSSDCD